MFYTRRLAMAAVALGLAAHAAAQQPDPHAIYETRCATCHEPHASDFTRGRLDILGEELVVGTSGKPVEAVLAAGHGRLAPEEAATLVAFLSEVRQSDGLYESKCRICHDRARDLARSSLVIREDRVTGRYTGRDIAAFLGVHGRMKPDEIRVFLDMFERQIRTKPEGFPQQ